MKDLPWNGGRKLPAESASGGIVTSIGLSTHGTGGGTGSASRSRSSALSEPAGTRVSVQPIATEGTSTMSRVGRFKT